MKIGDQSVLLPENLEELLNSASPCLFIGDLLGDGTQFDFSFIVAVDQSVIAFLVFCLVKGHMSIFVDALFNRIGKHLYFLNQCSFLGLQRREVKGKGQAAGQGCDDGILLGKKLVDCRNKVAVDIFICKVWCGAFVVAIKFVIALPDDLFVLIIGVPGFGAVPASAFATANFAGEKVDTASSTALAFAVPFPAEPSRIPLGK